MVHYNSNINTNLFIYLKKQIMKKRFYIALVKLIPIGDDLLTVFEKVSLEGFTLMYDTLDEAERAIEKLGDDYIPYTILTEYYNTN